MVRTERGPHAWLQAAPFAAVFLFFFLVPLALVVAVSFWNFNDYELLPAFTFRNYLAIFDGCGHLNERGAPYSAKSIASMLN